jgi:serine protease AprX
MPIAVPRAVVEFILLGPEDDRRQLQDSPILGDVWLEFATNPAAALELLITPYRDQAAGTVASELADCGIEGADIAYLQGIVAARLSFVDVLRSVVPMTHWYRERHIEGAIREYLSGRGTMEKDIGAILRAAQNWLLNRRSEIAVQDLETRKRYIALAGLILWAQEQDQPEATGGAESLKRMLDESNARAIAQSLRKALPRGAAAPARSLVWTISLNRHASPALTKSVPAVKADAARTLFTVDCSEIVWAVVDSGVDAGHHAFVAADGARSRVAKSFDFTRIRDIVSLDNLRDDAKRKERVKKLLAHGLKDPPTPANAEQQLLSLARDAREGRTINWELVQRLVEIDPAKCPVASSHGTHVAGIIGADGRGAERAAERARAAVKKSAASARTPSRRPGARSGAVREAPAAADSAQDGDAASGMCPEILLYDFRVLGPSLKATEFAIIAALQYIRYVNERNSYITIHGANLSLSIPHDVRNYACGRTPVCNECERLVGSGVVVVAAAGNRGYQNFETNEGLYQGYAAFSVTDPGNADGVITVGATHRSWPHTYGVSFFSSRGPTGDGRLKPDVVAPGERIRAPLPDNAWGDLDGTSMAAPHVSGAAAMLMARYSELIGQPRRIKQILCESATDLGRERSFQGYGMLDVLRAFQSI